MLNTVIISGRLTKHPEKRVTGGGVTVTRFTVAVDRDYGDKQTDFINCVAFRATGDFVDRYFDKGDMISVNGSLHMNSYTDREGKKRTDYEVAVDRAYFCGSKKAVAQLEDISGDDGDLPWVD